MLKFKSFLQEKAMPYNELKISDITRRGRSPIVLDKIKNQKTFLAKRGDFIVDKNAASTKDFMVQIESPPRGYKAKLSGKLNGKSAVLTFPTDFLKDATLGGKGAGSGTAAEDAALTAFRIELEGVIEKTGESEIDMIVGGRKVRVSGIESTPGTPKSDFHLVDAAGVHVAWLSHKDGTKASQFQQYGGLTADWNRHYSKNAEVLSFINAVKKKRPEGLQRGDSFFRAVKDKKVSRLTIWGPDYGGVRGKNNVDEFHQGVMKLNKVGNAYKIKSTHSAKNGTISGKASSGNYSPIYVARFTSDRGFSKGGGVKNARIGVFARDYVSSKAEEI